MRSQKPEDRGLTDAELRAKYNGWLNDLIKYIKYV